MASQFTSATAHFAVMFAAGAVGDLNTIVYAIIATLATRPVAAASWFLVEKPAMSLKHRLMKKWSTPPSAHHNQAANPFDLMGEKPPDEVSDPAASTDLPPTAPPSELRRQH